MAKYYRIINFNVAKSHNTNKGFMLTGYIFGLFQRYKVP